MDADYQSLPVMIGDMPDVKLTVLQCEYDTICQLDSLPPIKDWLEGRIAELQDEVREVKIRQAKAHSVDDALMNAPHNPRVQMGWRATSAQARGWRRDDFC